jgi:hypothetical protein
MNTDDKEFQQAFMEKMDENVGIITLVTGELENGKPYHAYALIKPSHYFAFKEAEKKGNYDLAEFGEILAHGEGLEPPEATQKMMQEKYGANHRFEEELASIITQTQKTFRNFPG